MPSPRPHIKDLVPYSAARHEHPDAASDGYDGALLDANENPEATYAEAAARVALNRYPDPMCSALRRTLADRLAVDAGNIVCGNGSDELIDLLIRIYGQPGGTIAICPPTYGMYTVQAAIHAMQVAEVPYRIDREPTTRFALDVVGIRAATSSALPPTKRASIVFLCTPNNPTGQLIDPVTILDLARGCPDTLFIIDEAYIDFTMTPAGTIAESVLVNAPDTPNLVVLRTFSKARGLAGARLGFAVCSREIASYLDRVRLPYNVSSLTQAAGLAALADDAAYREGVRAIVARRDALMRALEQRGLEIVPSVANFFCFRLPEGVDASAVHDRLARAYHILVRDRSRLPGLENCLRVNVGTEAEHERLLAALDRILETRTG